MVKVSCFLSVTKQAKTPFWNGPMVWKVGGRWGSNRQYFTRKHCTNCTTNSHTEWCVKSPIELNFKRRGLAWVRQNSTWKKVSTQRAWSIDGDLAELIKRSVSDRLGDLVPQVRARTSPGFFNGMVLLGLCLETFFQNWVLLRSVYNVWRVAWRLHQRPKLSFFSLVSDEAVRRNAGWCKDWQVQRYKRGGACWGTTPVAKSGVYFLNEPSCLLWRCAYFQERGLPSINPT